MSLRIAIDFDAVRRPVQVMPPTGPDLSLDSNDRVHRQIRDARPINSLPDQQSVATDWGRIARLGLDALYDRTKDLQIAAWVVEALAQLNGLAGLAAGFELMHALQDSFWAEVHPIIENGDAELRITPYTFLTNVLPSLIQTEISLVGEANRSPELTLAGYDQALAAGTIDTWTLVASRADPGDLETVQAGLEQCCSAFATWEADTRARFGADTPDLGPIATALRAFEKAFETVVPRFRESVPPSVPSAPEQTTPRPYARPEPEPLAPAGRPDGVAPEPFGFSTPDVVARAEGLARAGQLAEALGVLDEIRHTTRSRRESFLMELHLAEFCVEGGRPNLALQLLEGIEAEVDDRRLEDWEDPAVCARVHSALIRTLRALDSDDSDRLRKLFTRLCRLDPQRALGLDPIR